MASAYYYMPISKEILIFARVDDFEYNKSSDLNVLQKLTLSNDLVCSSGGSACEQFISDCTTTVISFKSNNSSFAVARMEGFAQQVSGVLNIAGKQENVQIYYNLNDNGPASITGLMEFNEMKIKFKGKK